VGVLVQVILSGVLAGALAALPFLVYQRSALPALARADARPAAYLVAVVPAVGSLAVAVAFVRGWVFGAPTIDILWLIGTSVLSSMLTEMIVRPAIRLTRGSGENRSTREVELEARIAAAERHFQRMDLDRYVTELELTAGTWTPESVDVHEAIRRVLDAHRRREPPAVLAERHHDLERATQWQWRPPAGVRRAATIATLVAFLGVSAPIIGSGAVALRVCIAADFVSEGIGGAAPTTDTSLAEAIVADPEAGAALAFDEPVDLSAAAESRHDPDTRAQLEATGFVRGHLRGWSAVDGRTLQADAFEFATHQGAVAYQRTVTGHACEYANETFEGPNGGIGLQVRYSTGDPIVEQVSWVDGTRRYLVAVSHLEPPATHDRILAILARATGSR